MKKTILTLSLFLLMFPFQDKAAAQYDKIFFDLNIDDINGKNIDLSIYNNKAILLVNVASKCGFTKQYDDLQKLWEIYKDKGLIVLGVPSNQFGGQEPGTNQDIKNFCEVNFNINFPLTEITDVKGNNAHEIYKWAKDNHGKSAVPKWNFYKILINKEGKIEDTFASFTKPMSGKLIKKIEGIL